MRLKRSIPAGMERFMLFSPKKGAGCASDGDQQPRTPVDSTLAARPLSNKWQLYGVEWNYR